jgi:hypothetical protein
MQPQDLFRHLCAMKLQTHFLLLSQGHLCRIQAHQLQQKGDATRQHPRPLPEHLAVHELDATAPCTVPIPNHLPLVQLVTNTATLRVTSGLSSRRWKGKMGVFFASMRQLVFTCRSQADALAFRQQHAMGTHKKMQNLVSKQVLVFCVDIYLNIMMISGLRDVISCASPSRLRRLSEPSLITDTEKARQTQTQTQPAPSIQNLGAGSLKKHLLMQLLSLL